MTGAGLLQLRSQLDSHGDQRIVDYHGGRPRVFTFRDLGRDVDRAVDRLRTAGVRRGARIGLFLGNRYESIVFDLAAVELRCPAVAFVPEVVGDGLDAVFEKYPIELLVTDDRRLTAARHPQVADVDGEWGDVRCRSAPSPPANDDLRALGWVFSSGSIGRIRCIEASRDGLEGLMTSLVAQFAVSRSDSSVLFLPLASLQQKLLTYAALWSGAELTISTPQQLFRALRERRPTVLLAPPAFYEAIAQRIESTSRLARLGMRAALAAAARAPRILGDLVRARVSAAVRGPLGGRLRLMLTGMAPIRSRTLWLFHRLGLPLFEAYGMTECGIIAWNTPSAYRIGSVGRVLQDVKVTMASDGELFVQREAMPTLGYRLEPPADGLDTYRCPNLIATGDVGRFDRDGFLYLLGRKKNVIVTGSGVKLHPEVLEGALARCGQILQSVVVCDRKGALVAVVVPTRDDGAARTAVSSHVAALNREAEADTKIARVAFAAPFAREDGTLTANLKVNREAIRQRYIERTA